MANLARRIIAAFDNNHLGTSIKDYQLYALGSQFGMNGQWHV